jgi:transcriptional regulator with XRE-family HTH domain
MEKLFRQVSLDNWEPIDIFAIEHPKMTRLEKLIESIKRLTAPRGAKAKLAREFGVSRQALDQWLRHENAPSAELALRLDDWVQSVEARETKSSEDALTSSEPKTPKGTHLNEITSTGPAKTSSGQHKTSSKK